MMNDYIVAQLAADRAEKLRSEAEAHRFARLFTRRAQREARIPQQTRRSLRAAH